MDGEQRLEHGVSGLTFEMLDPAPVGIAITRGREHRLIYTNRRYRSLFGNKPLGAPMRELFTVFRRDYSDLFDKVVRTGEPIVLTDEPGDPTLKTPDGQERFFTFSLSQVTFQDGVGGVLLVCVEVTDQLGAAKRIQAIADERSRILRRYRSLVRVSAQMLWVNSVEGGFTERVPEWERVTGMTWEEYRGDGWLRAVHPDDRPELVRSWTRAVREVPEVWEHVYRIHTVEHGYRHFLSRAVPIMEGDRLVEWVGTYTDVEQRWRQQRGQRLLERAGEAMARRASVEEMLGVLADVIVPELADGCGVHLVTELAEGLTGRSALAVERVAAASRPDLPDFPRFSAQRLTLRKGAFVDAVTQSRVVRRTFPPGEPPDDLTPASTQAWMRAAGANSVVILPVTVGGVITAVITAATCGDRPPMQDYEIDLLREAFEQAHDLLRNVMSLQRARQFAVAMQHSLLAEPPRVPGLEITARYRPSPSAAEVGGDWYDSFVLGDGVTILVIGDVAGHDLRAAVGMGRLRNMLRSLAIDREEAPGEVLRRLNRVIDTLYGEETATCVLARLERGEDGHQLHYSLAGHPPPLLITPDGAGRFLDSAANPLLGIPYDGEFDSARVALPPGGTLLFYTDGLVEREDEDFGDGLARLCDSAARRARAPLDEFCDRLLSDMPISGVDDVAMIAVRLPG